MIVRMHFSNLEPTEAIKQRIQEKSEKLGKFFDGNFEVEWTCSIEKGFHRSHVLLSGDRMTFNADSVLDNLYKTMDEAVDKLVRQLEKKKSISRNHIHRRRERDQAQPPRDEDADLEDAV